MTRFTLIAFFVFVMAAISAAGYVFVLRPAKVQREAAQIPAVLTVAPDVPMAEAAVLDMFRLIGEAFKELNLCV